MNFETHKKQMALPYVFKSANFQIPDFFQKGNSKVLGSHDARVLGACRFMNFETCKTYVITICFEIQRFPISGFPQKGSSRPFHLTLPVPFYSVPFYNVLAVASILKHAEHLNLMYVIRFADFQKKMDSRKNNFRNFADIPKKGGEIETSFQSSMN